MINHSLYVDTDLALGSKWGDVDDAFALCALLCSQDLLAIASVGGNTSEQRASVNLQALLQTGGFAVPILRGANNRDLRPSEASQFLIEQKKAARVLALGPLTNIATAIRGGASKIERITLVGSTLKTHGRFPPFWPMEFNLTKDRKAFETVFESSVPLVIAPLDICRRLQIRWDQLLKLPAPFGPYLVHGSRRWWIRARWLKQSATAPIWDLVAALYEVRPELFQARKTTAIWRPRGWLEYEKGHRQVTVIYDFEPGKVWAEFESLLGAKGRFTVQS